MRLDGKFKRDYVTFKQDFKRGSSKSPLFRAFID